MSNITLCNVTDGCVEQVWTDRLLPIIIPANLSALLDQHMANCR